MREVGEGSFTKYATDLLRNLKKLYPKFYSARMLQCNVMNGAVVPLPPDERGRPDYFCIYDGQVFCIELKVGKNKLSPDQEGQMERLLESGAYYYTPRTPEELVEVLHRHGLKRIAFS